MRTVIYPGSFDPLTFGHLDVIERASRLFDKVIVAVADNADKRAMFSLTERRRMLSVAVKNMDNVEAVAFSGLLVDFAEANEACAIVRGLRAVSDFEFEFQMALMNRRLKDHIETIFMMPRGKYSYLSSRLVKEVAGLGGDVEPFVPPHVARALARKLRPRKHRAKT